MGIEKPATLLLAGFFVSRLNFLLTDFLQAAAQDLYRVTS
jgi:hypothetical protein